MSFEFEKFDPSRSADKKKAWALAKKFGVEEADFKDTWRWHHSHDKRLVLVPRDLHEGVGHTGSYAREVTHQGAMVVGAFFLYGLFGNAYEAHAGEHEFGDISVMEGLLLDINPVYQFLDDYRAVAELGMWATGKAAEEVAEMEDSDGVSVRRWVEWGNKNPRAFMSGLFGARLPMK